MSNLAANCRAALLRARKRGALERRTRQMILVEYGAIGYADRHWGFPDGSVLELVIDRARMPETGPLFWRAWGCGA